MSKFVPVSREKHATSRWLRPVGFEHAGAQSAVAIVALELAAAAGSMPLAFVRRDGGYLLIALLSYRPNDNLFVDRNGGWLLDCYIPAAFRAHPFRLFRREGRDELTLCVDDDSALVGDFEEGERLFQDDGTLAGSVSAVIDFLRQVEQSRVVTSLGVDALASLDLLVPWNLKLREQGEEQQIADLYRVDETRLDALSGEQLGALRDARALGIAYGQIISMTRVGVFARLKALRENASRGDLTFSDLNFDNLN